MAAQNNPFDAMPTAKDLMKQIALREAEKASDASRAKTAEEAEKKAPLEQLSNHLAFLTTSA